MKLPKVRHIQAKEIAKVLKWPALIKCMEQALVDLSQGKVQQPTRQMIVIEEGKRYLGVMPAVAPDAMGLKLVSFYPGNADKGIHTHFATIILSRPSDGVPLATLDGTLITEMRTAAVSAAAAKHLAKKDAKVLAILGAGVQARAHLEAMKQVRKFKDIRVWSHRPDSARKFAKAHKVKAAASAEAAVKDADVIVTVTNAREPILKGIWVKPGAFIASVGAPRPTWREMDDALMQNACVIADNRAAVMTEAGDVIQSGAKIRADIGEIISGKAKAPAGKTVVFKSVGLAVEDVATARLVYGLLNKKRK